MPTPPLSDDDVKRSYGLFVANQHSIKRAAEAAGMPYQTFRHHINVAKARGFHIDPAIKDSMAAVGTNMVPRLAWAKTKSEDGTSYSVLLKPEESDSFDAIKQALSDIDPAPIIPAPALTLDDMATVYPLADVHIGMMAWGRETGEDYDTAIASRRVREWVARAVDASPASSEAVILGVGDLTHADDQTNMTPRSKHVLDVDTRHFKTLEMTIQALAYAIEYAARKHKKVTVRILPGNHDANTYMAVMFALAERYRNNDRIEVQKVPGEFWAYRFGKCFFAAHHGHGGKPERMVMWLADEYAEDWGKTKHRVLWTGHLHSHKSADIGGVTWEQLRAVTARDAYSVGNAYVARSQLQAITFDRTRGEIQRVKISA